MLKTPRLAACLFLTALLVACAPPAQQTAPAPSGPVAGTINGEAVPQAMLDSYAQARFKKPAAELNATELEQTRADFVRLLSLAQQARKEGLANDPQLELQRMNGLAQLLLRKHVEANPITDEMVRAQFQKVVDTGEAREYKARHILVENQEDAAAVIAELDGGADFAELAKTRSTGPSGPQGGDLGWFGAGRMVEPFWLATIELEPGNYTKEPVQTQFGWHVILLEETRERPFEEASAGLREQLQREQVDALVNGLAENATATWN